MAIPLEENDGNTNVGQALFFLFGNRLKYFLQKYWLHGTKTVTIITKPQKLSYIEPE